MGPAHVVERLRASREPPRRARVLDVPVPRGAVRPAGLVRRAPRLAAPRHARDRRGRIDRAARRARARRRPRLRRARALPSRLMRIRAAVLREPGHPVAVEEVELDPPKADEVLVRDRRGRRVPLRRAARRRRPGAWSLARRAGPRGRGRGRGGRRRHHARPPGRSRRALLRPGVPRLRVLPRRKAEPLPRRRRERARAARSSTARAGFVCRTGRRCSTGFATACFADFAVVAAGGAVPIPRELPLWQAALLGCGVVTGMGAVRNAAQVQPGDAAAVIGCGGVGLQVVAALRLAGADPIVALDRVPEKLELALAQGATHTIATSAEPDPVARAPAAHGRWRRLRLRGRRATGDDPPCLGPDSPGRHGGRRRACAGRCRGERSGDRVPRTTNRSAARTTARATPLRSCLASRRMALAGELDLAGVVTSVGPLEGVNDALDRLRHGEGARTVLIDRPDAGGLRATADGGSTARAAAA